MARKPAKSFSKHPYQFEPIELNFGQVTGMHPLLDNLAALSSNLEYLLDSVREVVSPDYFLQLLQMHPLAIAKDKSQYYCISNPRLFQIAKIVLPDNQLLGFREMVNPRPESIAGFGQTDFYLCHLLFSLRLQDGNDQLCRIWQQLDDDLKREVTPGIKHQTVLVKLLQASRNLPYLRRKEPGKKNNDSGD
ncbi:MAG: hypothetical protein Q7U38_04590 [Methylobacter sp.]|nr:hypothetical protein [Methylobacter sp.]MDP2097870.1 hypothetical protein [Methylobacter sp.]MDP2427376.1 hypothetical protein [Methylobacter sp.]MDP3055410.1 hypothetical protein [Methylobacter sp.]MDP3361316.1 hypothetical protein [Methylobacter sp.]